MARVAPPLTDRTAEFWRSGADGVLRIARCQACARYLHPPQPICPRCHGRDVRFEPVTGRGHVYSWTVNRYQWSPGMPPPYVLAEVELQEQEGLRILTNIVDCEPDKVTIGMPVSVAFERAGDAWIPVFRP
ncbi:MAG: Zn-ribbon domain-containing OB-fold protein [Acidimicrobiales bacterium]